MLDSQGNAGAVYEMLGANLVFISMLLLSWVEQNQTFLSLQGCTSKDVAQKFKTKQKKSFHI